MMKEYSINYEKVLKNLKTSHQGISPTEAKDRLEKYGPNKLAEAKKESLLQKFIGELMDPMTIILVIAATISGLTAMYQNEGFADVIIIMLVVITNACLGVYQESKAEQALEALQEIAAAHSVVIRDGHQIEISSDSLVPGDIIVLEAGASIPADARIIEGVSLKVEEAALTGESVASDKTADVINILDDSHDVPLGDRKNMIYMGTTVVYGRGLAVITATGMNTEMGKIANVLVNATEEKTPLQIKLGELSKKLSLMILAICVFIFAVDLGRTYLTIGAISNESILNTFMVAVSLAVAAIPEGLATVVTILLSIGVTKMSKSNAIIRKLTAVETLGCTQIICSDKTGTLTQNKMTVVEHYTKNKDMLVKAMALCNDAHYDGDIIQGEPTEVGLLADAPANGLNVSNLKDEFKRVKELPFDSVRKMMSTIHSNKEGKYIQFTKGAPDVLLSKCTTYYSDGKMLPLTDDIRKSITIANKNMADKALRVLAASFKIYDKIPQNIDSKHLETDLCFVGLSGMIDPVRPEVKAAIDRCRMAGIRPIMITGDHIDTAVAIANELGILQEGQKALRGIDLDKISDEDLIKNIEDYSVYARVQPEHKVRIVNAWKKHDKITAMTGDGINDAPSIKISDIGVGMGITGTDVTKNVADMVLADDNFATIVVAVAEGRRIYDNIRKSIQFLLSANLAEVIAVFAATILGFTILEPVHLLWINLITDCFPAIALGMEVAEKDVMQHKPRDSKDSIFAGGMEKDIFLQGAIIAIITVASYFIGHYMESGVFEIAESKDGMTMAFLTLSITEIFHAFNMRSINRSIFNMSKHNLYLYGSLIFSLILTTAVIYVPFLREAFDFSDISLVEYLTAMDLP